jgi:hypothetical protein
VSPQILNLVIAFVEEKQEMWKGFLYVVLLGITSILIGPLSLPIKETVSPDIRFYVRFNKIKSVINS